jgi:PncC family amidohydrolase
VANQAGREAKDHLLTGPASTDLSLLAARLQSLALERGLTLATAESCTGGLVGHAITENPGSSEFYLGGVVSYSDTVKIAQLGIAADLIAQHGAVSAEVATAMAVGVRERLRSDLAVAVTGIAGPGGGTPAKPVGLTYVAVCGASGRDVRRHVWHGDRSENKQRSASAALELAIDFVEASMGVSPGLAS